MHGQIDFLSQEGLLDLLDKKPFPSDLSQRDIQDHIPRSFDFL
jgi:hypothetical protein